MILACCSSFDKRKCWEKNSFSSVVTGEELLRRKMWILIKMFI